MLTRIPGVLSQTGRGALLQELGASGRNVSDVPHIVTPGATGENDGSGVTKVQIARVARNASTQAAAQSAAASASTAGTQPTHGVNPHPSHGPDLADAIKNLHKFLGYIGSAVEHAAAAVASAFATTNYWGVDSAGYVDQARYDYVVTNMGKPDFWGRYVGGLYGLVGEELTFLKKQGCRILVVYNGTQHGRCTGGIDQGKEDAKKATTAADGFGIPSSVCVFADIEESWPVTAEWLQGFAIQMSDNNRTFGFYANASRGAFPDAYQKACKAESKVSKAYLFCCTPCKQPDSATGSMDNLKKKADANKFVPNRPSTNPDKVVVWQYYIHAGGKVVSGKWAGEKVDVDLGTHESLALMWKL